LNTSAEIEAAIVGKPVFTLDAGDLAPGQGGSTHFSYMLRENGGCVEHATSIEQHLDQLADGLGGAYDREAIAEFVKSFVRPHGIDKPVTPILAQAIMDLAASDVDETELGRLAGALAPVQSRESMAERDEMAGEDDLR
jgi:hypothetical protein